MHCANEVDSPPPPLVDFNPKPHVLLNLNLRLLHFVRASHDLFSVFIFFIFCFVQITQKH